MCHKQSVRSNAVLFVCLHDTLRSWHAVLHALLPTVGVYKVETIGDCYMVAGGLVRRDGEGYKSVLTGDEQDELHAVRGGREGRNG